MQNMGDVKGAMQEKEAVLTAMTSTLGPTHPQTLKTRANLSTSYHNAGNYEAAARELETVVEARTTTLGPRHTDTLLAQVNLANTRRELGDVQGAVALLEVAAPALEAAGHYHATAVRARLQFARRASRRAARKKWGEVIDEVKATQLE